MSRSLSAALAMIALLPLGLRAQDTYQVKLWKPEVAGSKYHVVEKESSNSHVTVKVKEPDRYGRLVARVIAEGKDVSHELVKAGLAWHFKKYSSERELAELEDKAREARVGIWSMPNQPPWDFRHNGQAPRSKTKADSAEGLAVVYHGNVNSRVFHRPSCPSYDCRNCTRILNSREEALVAGFKPCRICRP